MSEHQQRLDDTKARLQRHAESTMERMRKQKDAEIAKLRASLDKCQNDLKEAVLQQSSANHTLGLSGEYYCKALLIRPPLGLPRNFLIRTISLIILFPLCLNFKRYLIR
mgnify:CR=1 FL=1